jgi:hypothetical protein
LSEPHTPTTTKLLVFHIGMETEEMNALVDQNPGGLLQMSKHRKAELDVLTNAAFRTEVHRQRYDPVTYRELIHKKGLSAMKHPAEGNY